MKRNEEGIAQCVMGLKLYLAGPVAISFVFQKKKIILFAAIDIFLFVYIIVYTKIQRN